VTGKTSRSREVIASIMEAAQEAQDAQQEQAVGAGPAPGRPDRSWERQHKATALRLHADDDRWLAELADNLKTTRDAVGRGLIQAAREAIQGGWLVLEIEQEIEHYKDKIGRSRTRVIAEPRHRWQFSRSEGSR
jgi:hypothetical protein